MSKSCYRGLLRILHRFARSISDAYGYIRCQWHERISRDGRMKKEDGISGKQVSFRVFEFILLASHIKRN